MKIKDEVKAINRIEEKCPLGSIIGLIGALTGSPGLGQGRLAKMGEEKMHKPKADQVINY